MTGPPPKPDPERTAAGAAAISGHLDTRTAAMEIAHQIHDEQGPGADLVFLFASFHHRAAFADAIETLNNTLDCQAVVGTTAESVVGGDEEREGLAGMVALAVKLPGMKTHVWTSTPDDPVRISEPETIPDHLGIGPDFRGAILLADPFSTPISRLLPALNSAIGPDRPVRVIGGMASGASQPGHNVLAANDRIISAGAVGVSLSGDIELDSVVSQGCRPIGRPFVVTKAKGNVILELGGVKALDALQELAQNLPDEEKKLLSKGLLVGCVINEYKKHFGRGDFLIRNVLGLDQRVSGIAVGELGRVGQTIQFHVRDAESAAEDLQLLLDGQQLDAPPAAGLLFTCNGRGTRLFDRPHHDITVIRERLGDVPVAGFFAAGEIGPIGNETFLHGHTVSLALLRPKN